MNGDRTAGSVPDVFSEEIRIGWRVWLLDARKPGNPLLVSRFPHGHSWTVWEGGKELTARCLPGRSSPGCGEAPGEMCNCGIYAKRQPDDELAGMLRSTDPSCFLLGYADQAVRGEPVLGTVKLWGKICDHHKGWRAKYVYPLEIFLPPDLMHLAPALRDAYPAVKVSPAKANRAAWKTYEQADPGKHLPPFKRWLNGMRELLLERAHELRLRFLEWADELRDRFIAIAWRIRRRISMHGWGVPIDDIRPLYQHLPNIHTFHFEGRLGNGKTLLARSLSTLPPPSSFILIGSTNLPHALDPALKSLKSVIERGDFVQGLIDPDASGPAE